ncbi:ABC transporter ATPase [Corynebacterium deserti GIMN1.010]|uniref:ABC transporter ATPase n=1 Tax=Corynebacterium deserti GIMN1.010 TaxID=931089 RepID=A0A0M4CQ99_9CORY|nr:ABC transporter ATP-binding protein [Corynebacterium deserti]ALC06030.1 ABC transporter ATPase [Corynebacterium deserti GIMN1.010]
MIEAHGLTHRFGTHVVINDVDLYLPATGLVSLVGPNGSGKTTLLRALYGALTPDEGEVLLDGDPLAKRSRKDIAQSMAVVIQEHDSDLPMTVADLVMLGRLPYQRVFSTTTSTDEELVHDALQKVGATHLAIRPYGALSGGERQRVLIARALVQNATHILLDEPTNHLDIRYQHDVLHLVRSLAASSVVVLHDLNLAAAYSDHVILLNDGSVITQGAPEDVLTAENLEPIYGVQVDRLDIDGEVHLRFRRPSHEGLEP